jgi:hypothetical protein
MRNCEPTYSETRNVGFFSSPSSGSSAIRGQLQFKRLPWRTRIFLDRRKQPTPVAPPNCAKTSYAYGKLRQITPKINYFGWRRFDELQRIAVNGTELNRKINFVALIGIACPPQPGRRRVVVSPTQSHQKVKIPTSIAGFPLQKTVSNRRRELSPKKRL